jgi:hypothetical protein
MGSDFRRDGFCICLIESSKNVKNHTNSRDELYNHLVVGSVRGSIMRYLRLYGNVPSLVGGEGYRGLQRKLGGFVLLSNIRMRYATSSFARRYISGAVFGLRIATNRGVENLTSQILACSRE